ncbi:Putative arginine/ornithine antiporter [Candidatus Arsenophonus lipoptenae]|uniref:Putative arginine/ornithine antiporter n=1 Tax=Candidatus Arsenophonus lipoptenae TaxID=634113 RepID=A0A0X9VNA4_9GAMM|nr:basic amino acid/polyamine antiporter [Candidatus Arsenophonus lipoptenae]AMA65211.1 Putative arginine/ornithine antiporter [Candidatus Arsenophonus lipoptenae]
MKKKLNLTSLTTLVLSSMVGAGAFSLPQNIAEVASPLALIICWSITGIGVLFIAISLLLLSRVKPSLDGGIYTYAKEGFGELVGFCSAWGYWLCSIIANVSYLVIVFATFSFFTDQSDRVIFGDGNTWQAIIVESILLWIMHCLVLRGTHLASKINKLITVAKLIPLSLFIILAFVSFKKDIFQFDFSGVKMGISIWQQVKNSMLITLWVFIGIEGAIVVSAQAQRRKDIGIATVLAVILALSIYVLITLLPLGIVYRSELAGMKNPSMLSLMINMIGNYGKIIISVGLILSVFGAYLSWIIMTIEIPYIAALYGAFPQIFKYKNKNNTPSVSLLFTNISIQLSLILIWLSVSNYNILLTIATEMILIPYFILGAFLSKISIKDNKKVLFIFGIMTSLYSLWLLYAAGIINLLLSIILYIPGIFIFLYIKYQNNKKKKTKNKNIV